jgi:Zn-dependent protease
MNLETAILLLPGLVIGLSLHEFAHAWSASLLGDNFARRQGRVSLNPLRHLSILGTLALFVIGFGWGKPVQINLNNFKHPKRDYLITSLAGPLANIIIVICCIALAHLIRHDYSYGDSLQPFLALAHVFLMFTALINTILATINLLPIPPLDGSKIWPCLIPGLKPSFAGKGIWIFIIGIILLVRGGHLDPVFDFVINSTAYYMPEPDSSISEGYLTSGEIAYESEEYEDAEAFFTAALRFNPRSDQALLLRAVTRMRIKKWHEAMEDIDRCIALDGPRPGYIEVRQSILNAIKPARSQPDSRPADTE